MTLSFDNCQYTSRPTPEVTVMWYPAANPLYMSICQRSFIVSPYLADYVACFCGFIESNASHLLDIRWLICGYSRELVACTEACIQNIRKMHAAFEAIVPFSILLPPRSACNILFAADESVCTDALPIVPLWIPCWSLFAPFETIW